MSRKLYRILLIIGTVVCIVFGSAYNITSMFIRAISHLVPFSDRIVEELENLDIDWDGDGEYFQFSTDDEIVDETWKDELSDCKNVDIDVEFMDVKILAGDEYYVSYNGSNNLTPTVTMEDDTLKIKQTNNNVTDWSSYSNSCELTICLPEEEYDSLNFEVNAGNLEITSLTFENMDISADAGNIALNNITTDDLNMQISAGDLAIEQLTVDDMDIQVSAGNIQLKQADIENGKVELNMGDFKFDGNKFHKLKADVNMGEIRIITNDPLTNYKIDLSCDAGSVEYEDKYQGTSYSQSGNDGELEAECNMGEVSVN